MSDNENEAGEELVAPATILAAKRGFVRTTLQGYEATLAVGLSANAILALVQGQPDWVTVGVTAAVAVFGPPIAGLRSYISIYRNGIPAEYVAAAAEQDDVEG